MFWNIEHRNCIHHTLILPLLETPLGISVVTNKCFRITDLFTFWCINRMGAVNLTKENSLCTSRKIVQNIPYGFVLIFSSFTQESLVYTNIDGVKVHKELPLIIFLNSLVALMKNPLIQWSSEMMRYTLAFCSPIIHPVKI